MPSYGSKVACPGCRAGHGVRVGEINSRRQIEYSRACGGTVTIEHDGSGLVVQGPGTRKVLKLKFNDAD